MAKLLENSKRAIQYWWLMLLAGIVMLVMGVAVFALPAVSYLVLTILFGWMIFLSGCLQIVLYITSKHVVTASGWMLAGGSIETLLGLILIFSMALSASTLPLFLGFWLLFKGFSMIGFGSDMNTFKVSGAGWVIFTAVILMITALYILMQPMIFGVQAVLVWVGISLLLAGVSVSVFAIQLRNAHKQFTE